VQGAASVSTGVRSVQRFLFLGLQYDVLRVGTVVFTRTCQHIDGWTDPPKLANATIPAAAP
jgi:hypothetical protein